MVDPEQWLHWDTKSRHFQSHGKPKRPQNTGPRATCPHCRGDFAKAALAAHIWGATSRAKGCSQRPRDLIRQRKSNPGQFPRNEEDDEDDQSGSESGDRPQEAEDDHEEQEELPGKFATFSLAHEHC